MRHSLDRNLRGPEVDELDALIYPVQYNTAEDMSVWGPGGGSGESYTHEGEEFLHILRGEFEIWLNTDEHYHMKIGDSLYFQSSTPHRWRNPGKTESWLLWINTPPTF